MTYIGDFAYKDHLFWGFFRFLRYIITKGNRNTWNTFDYASFIIIKTYLVIMTKRSSPKLVRINGTHKIKQYFV